MMEKIWPGYMMKMEVVGAEGTSLQQWSKKVFVEGKTML